MPELGLAMGHRLPFAAMLNTVKEAERRGLDFVGLGEGLGRGVFPELAVFAQSTQRIKLMTMIISIFGHSFVSVAAAIAFVDQISKGRAMLGLGSSIPHLVENMHGIKFEKPARRMKEYVQIVQQLLAKQPQDRVFVDVVHGGVNYQGELFQIQGATIDVEPEQEHLPVYVAAVGPRMIEVAGEVADGVILEHVSPGYLHGAKERLALGAQRADRDVSGIEIMDYLLVSVAEDTKEAIDAVKPIMALHAAFPLYDSLWIGAGCLDGALQSREFYARGDLEGAARAIPDELILAVSIAGTPQECKRQLRERIETLMPMGVKAFALFPPVGTDMEQGYRAILDVAEGLT